ncbi:hypothetical protein BF17_04285 [Yersinia similis]|uniref:Uncharacterized protein n=1 Tax=Yersinia similis TaxID=367190 RepID=A0ABN4CTE5_9GAMM|nr:hypothetical protein [Yersinia similis]AHK21919.1 hypothetical protein BF17_04285 [Yersinia similis]
MAAAVLPQSFKILMDKSPLRFFIPLRLASLMLSHSDMGVEWSGVAAAVLPQSFKILMAKSPLRFFIPLRLASLMLSHSDMGVEWSGVAVAVLLPVVLIGVSNG